MINYIKGQRGFTLIELLAVMAILATLVAIVAPAVAGTRDASIQSQAQQDATQIRTAANKFFSAQSRSEVKTPHSVSTVTLVNGYALGPEGHPSVKQTVSNRWPEKYISISVPAEAGSAADYDVRTIGHLYNDVFNTTFSGADVTNVNLLDDKGVTITAIDFFTKYTAIDFGTVDTTDDATTDKGLVTLGYLAKRPQGLDLKSQGRPNFLWLFSKESSSRDRVDDSRDMAVFKLVKVEMTENTVNMTLTYQRILPTTP